MNYIRVMRIFSLTAIFLLAMGAAFAERSFAQAPVEITVADLTDDTTGAESERETAQTKVNNKIKAATVTAGTTITFPSGEFKDVGEIQVFSKDGTPETMSPMAPAKPITLRGNGTVFTGKIMINVFDSSYIVIEGFTFRDTQAPDMVTAAGGGGVAFTGNTDNTAGRLEYTGVVWLNTAMVGSSPTCGATKPLDNIIVRDNVFMNTARHGVLARAKDSAGIIPSSSYAQCDSSAVTVSGNSFVGIGLGTNAAYLDAAKTLPGYQNRESAIEGDKTYGWTVTDNMIGVTADGEDAKGTTANGIRLDRAFGKTVVSNNTVNNTAWSGIVVGGDSVEPAAAQAEIMVANNKVTNSRNNPYIVSKWDSTTDGEGYDHDEWRFGTTGSARTSVYPATGEEMLDALLKARIHALPVATPPVTEPYLGEGEGTSRLVTSILLGEYTTGTRPPGVANAAAAHNRIPNEATVRYLRTGLEAGVELNRLTSEKVTVENNELTDNVVGLLVCPSAYCFADDPFLTVAVLAAELPPAGGSLKVPTVRNNSIYGNDKGTDMPRRFVRANVVNALTVANTGAGNNVLVLKGNYLGINPDEVGGAVNIDDLATAAPENVGPKETDNPGLASTGGATLDGTTITLRYDEPLDGESVPAAAAFTVTETTGGGLSGTITVSRVAVSGMRVTLTLAKAPGSGNTVTVSYDPSDAGSGGPIRDVVGNAAPALTSTAVTAPAPTPAPDPDPDPDPDPQPAAKADDGGCALASSGSGGADLGMLLAMMIAPLAFGLRRRAKEAG